MSPVRFPVFALACLALALALGGTASADDGNTPEPPRAIPIPRGFVTSTFAPSFSRVVDQAIAAAGDLTSASQRARALAAERAAVVAAIPQLIAAEAAGLTASERGTPGELDALVAQLHKKDAALAADQAVYERAGIWSLASADAKWTTPVKGGDLTQAFGPTDFYLEPPRTWNGVFYPSFHDGIDIAAAYGTPVVAAAPGQVIFAGHLSDGAYVVLVASIGGYVAEYAHLDDRAASPVRAGDIVRAGEQIGRIGLTGLTTGAHLHFETWHWGALTDPLSLIGS